MLVYGDPHFTATLGVLHARLCAHAAKAQEQLHDLDRLRALLIACGQVEQGVEDALAQTMPIADAAGLASTLRQVTVHAAEAFYSLAWRQPYPLPAPLLDAAAALGRLRRQLESMTSLPPITVTVKLPEGFSFHALYPEQYAVAAGRWLVDHPGGQAQEVLVAGVRSIGTTLAAVVATTLHAAGWQAAAITVRPRGHPFARTVDLGAITLRPATLGLVVDEGPGISGSSMAATAAALVEAGIAAHNIAFLPDHGNEPGGAGAPEVQHWWHSAPRYVARREDIAFGGLPLEQALAAVLHKPVVRVDNVSGGVWRQSVYAHSAEWPAICNHFERVKYLCTLEDGSKVLFKFMGLAAGSPALNSTAEAAAALLQDRALRGLAPPVVARAYGFVATQWIEGRPLTGDLPQAEIAETLGVYIAQAAGPPLDDAAFTAATDTLARMLYVNTREALGDAAAGQAQQLRPAAGCPRACYGDGHLQPHEWIRDAAGAIHKVDGAGHDSDHTLVGKQPVAWDLAGGIVEWQLDGDTAERLLRAYVLAGGAPVDARTLTFYRAAYLAFRAGICSLAAEMHDPYEKGRLQAAYGVYRRQLALMLP